MPHTNAGTFQSHVVRFTLMIGETHSSNVFNILLTSSARYDGLWRRMDTNCVAAHRMWHFLAISRIALIACDDRQIFVLFVSLFKRTMAEKLDLILCTIMMSQFVTEDFRTHASMGFDHRVWAAVKADWMNFILKLGFFAGNSHRWKGEFFPDQRSKPNSPAITHSGQAHYPPVIRPADHKLHSFEISLRQKC